MPTHRPMSAHALAVRAAEVSSRTDTPPLLVLADTSYSMRHLTSRGRPRIVELRAALAASLLSREDYTLAAFSSESLIVAEPQKLPEPAGNTMLAAALAQHAAASVERVLIATDGEPTDMPSDACLAVLERDFQWVRVDVLYVGEPRGSGETLMRAVVRNGGKLFTTDTDYLTSVTLLLEGRA